MKNYNLLVFDWDGTLVDSAGLTIESIQNLARDIEYPIPRAIDVHKYLGLPLEEILYQLFPKENQKNLAEKFYNYFIEEKLATRFFGDVVETLTYLKKQGFILSVATNKARSKLNEELALTNIKNLFRATRCPEDGAPKPDPRMLLTLLEELNIKSQDALMIGDTIFDMQFANNAQVDALAACYGYHSKEQLQAYNPIGFINNINELQTIL